MDDLFYFGCWERAGHYLVDRHGRNIRDYDIKRLRIPSGNELDGGMLFLPEKEVVGTGALTYLPAMDCTILAWWGSPWDSRGAVNTALICKGAHSELAIWTRFKEQFPPRLTDALKMPILVAKRREQ